ncbi:transforming acidic coiled-coil-containing protein 1 isoform X3 [Scleropages formosus]|uniref:transforming acidic coiled-coil-containing protein 1 isoform X3 n=1 Tax=Scleropages formosus TaxID=113540 RepID=UPI000878D5D5|nr:transforming acidic coiled-coil-containing protein 1-like isoform X3 [Scleropages formosus]
MSWSMLSPMQWAKWTWSAVRGGGEDEEEEGAQGAQGEMNEEEVWSHDEERSQGGSSDSEGHFETPEAETPVHSPLRATGDLEDLAANSPADALENIQERISDSAGLQNLSLDENSNQNELPLARQSPPADKGIAMQGEAVGALDNVVEGPHETPARAELLEVSQPISDPPDQHSEQLHNGYADENSAMLKVKHEKNRPASLKMSGDQNGTNLDDEVPVPKVSYKLDLDLHNDNVNPFTSGSSRVQNSPPPCDVSSKVQNSPSPCAISAKDNPAAILAEEPACDLKPVVMEFEVSDDGKSGGPRRPPPQRKLGKKPTSKLTPKKQQPKLAEPAPESTPKYGLDETPIPKSTYNIDPSQWDDPSFNPFGGNAKMGSSPVLPKESYTFDPDNFDDSVDPFKPSKTLAEEELTTPAPLALKPADDALCRKTELPLEEEGRGTQSPKKNKGRMITTTEQVRFLCFLLSACKVKKYENQSLVLDVCSQEDEPVVSQAPDISHRVGHATDEEKLASTTTVQKPNKLGDGMGGPSETAKQPMEGVQLGKADHLKDQDSGCPYDDPCRTKESKLTGSESKDKGSPVLDTICISEADKAAVLTLIREEIISKEIEAIEWKRKYEESRQEVMEMRKIVAEYEKTIAQMIDEQRTSSGSQRTIQQLTLERDQALADLNSVERSLSDLFRRYENMKGVLEGFKKNEEVLKKCAQEYLARVKQEEQRYQALKIHAEEKLDKANEEIAQVRAKANSESVALHATLRKEQMKVESLERALHQKNQEIEELTKICDELIAKLGRTD